MRLGAVALALAALCALALAQQSYEGEACPWYNIDQSNFNATAFNVRVYDSALVANTSPLIAALQLSSMQAVQQGGLLQATLLESCELSPGPVLFGRLGSNRTRKRHA